MTIPEQSYDGWSARVGWPGGPRRVDLDSAGGTWCVGKLRSMSELVAEAGALQKRALQLKEHL